MNESEVNKNKEKFLFDWTFNRLEDVKQSSPKLKNFFGVLNRVDHDKFAIFGGAVRDWWLNRPPKDIDIVIDSSPEVLSILSSNFEYTKTKFDGYQFNVDGILIDIWQLKDSWYFKQGYAEPSWEVLVNQVPFDIDTIMVFKNGTVLDRGFFKAIESKQMELKSAVNKNFEKFVIERALRFKEKYGITFGPALQRIIDLKKLPNLTQNPCGEISLKKPIEFAKQLNNAFLKNLDVLKRSDYGSSN